MKLISGETHRKMNQRMQSLEQQVEDLTGQCSTLGQLRLELEMQLRDAHQKLSQAIDSQASLQTELKEQSQAKQKAEQAFAAQLGNTEKRHSELKKLYDQLAQIQQALKASQEEVINQSQIAIAEREKRERLQQDLEKKTSDLSVLNEDHQELKIRQEKTSQENELLIRQLTQALEELVEYYDDKTRLEKLYETYKARWERLEKRHPNYVDYGALELLGFDLSSSLPSITWRLRDYSHAGVSLPEFVFRIALQDGQPGIGLVHDDSVRATKDSTLVPRLLATHRPQAARFLHMGNSEHRQLSAALVILAQMEANQWQGINLPKELNIRFWSPFVKQLAGQWAALPAALRYDTVKLKRELINPDYEHLWLELHGVSFDKRSWKKLEVRLGAALVDEEEFSKFPKFEIPLVDGKHKPFESWYPESHDDAGAKLELRFSLERNVFDAAVLGKLAKDDQILVLRLVYAMSGALEHLQEQKVAINRPWSTWIEFASGAVKVLELSRLAAKKTSKPVKTSEIAPPARTEMPEKGKQEAKATRAKASDVSDTNEATTKVINIAPVPPKLAAQKTARPKLRKNAA